MDKTLKRQIERKILFSLHDYIIGMIPEPVRKIVGLILLIFGAVAMLGGWFGAFFFIHDEMGIIIFIVGIFSFAYGIILLRHKG